MSWRKEPWALDVPYELSLSLDNFAHDDKKEPTLEMAIKEAKYIIDLHYEGGTLSAEELSGDFGPEAYEEAKYRIKEHKKFISKYK